MLTIFLFSSETSGESTKRSDGVIINTISFFKGSKLTRKEKLVYTEALVTLVRKGAHFTIYFILGLLVNSFIFEYTKKFKYLFMISLLICFLYACSDEIHQLFVVGRSGMFSDVLLDSFAAMISIFIYSKIKTRKVLVYE